MVEEKEHHSEHHEVHHEHHIQHKKNISLLKIGICIGVIAVIVLLFFVFRSSEIKEGSSVRLQYSIALANGTVIENGTTTAISGNISESLNLLSNKTDFNLLNQKKNAEIELNLTADEAFGQINQSLIYKINRSEKQNRTTESNRTLNITSQEFAEAFNSTPLINKSYAITGNPWNYTVLNFDAANITLRIETSIGELPSMVEGLKQEIILITDTKITIKNSLTSTQEIPVENGNVTIFQDDNYIITKFTPEVGKEIAVNWPGYAGGKVVSFDENSITVDANSEFAGQDVILKIKVLDVGKSASSTGKKVSGKKNSGPTMQVFVMSYCPYGLQMMKGMLPAWRLLGEKANFELRFVSYTMHGVKEDTENSRMICIREEQSSKLVDYLECFTDSGDANSCILTAGIDKSSLEDCMDSRASGYMETDKALNTQYGVQGSPTIVIEGKEAQINRDPESVKKAICDAFTSKPSECSQTLSTASPSPGFGSSSSSSSSSASCG